MSNKMTDLEICKRIAEIENISITVAHERTSYASLYLSNDIGDREGYNPLTDDALCFKFCYEDGIDINKCDEVADNKLVWNGKYYARHPKNTGFGSIDKNPNKAVCLEKIEANK